MKQMGVQDVSISQNSSWKSLNITYLTAIMQYKWDHQNIIQKQQSLDNQYYRGVVAFKGFIYRRRMGAW